MLELLRGDYMPINKGLKKYQEEKEKKVLTVGDLTINIEAYTVFVGTGLVNPRSFL